MPNVLVTGGFGTIGSWVTRTLVADGHDVTVFSRTANPVLIADVADSVRHHAGSIEEIDQVRQAITTNSVTHVIHCASSLSSAAERDPRAAYQTNLMGSLNVLQVAKEAGVERVIYTSSKGVYGRLDPQYGPPTYVPVGEDTEGEPTRVYSATKKALEGAVEQCRRVWGLEVIALRLGSTFGPGKSTDRAGYAGLKSHIVRAAISGTPLRIDNPDVVDDIVYTADAGRAHVVACFAPTPEHWQFNISGGRLVSVREYAAEVMNRCPGHKLTFGGPDEGAVKGFTQAQLDISRARSELGYEPQFPGVAGIADYIERERALTS